MDFTNYYYHLSTHPESLVDQKGLSRITSLSDIFKYWKKGLRFLHAIEVDSTVSFHENAHRDNVSNFTIDEHYMAQNIRTIKRWDLSNYIDQKELLEPRFKEHFNAGLFSSERQFIEALIGESSQHSLPQLIEELALDPIVTDTSFPHISNEAILKILPHCTVSDSYLSSIFSSSFFWDKLSIADQKKMNMAVQDDPFSDISYNDELITPLINYCLKNKAIKNDEIWQAIIPILMVTHQPYQDILDKLPSLSIESDVLICIVRQQKFESLSHIINSNKIIITGDLHRLIDRAVIYDENQLISKEAWQNRGGIDAWLRYESSRLASGHLCNNVSKERAEQLLGWQQHNSDGSLKETARFGFSLQCMDILSKQHPNQKEIDAAIVEASEHGYLEIVKLLFNHGASLSAHGNWPIKYANKFHYPELKTFLLAHEVIDARFN